MQKDTAVVEGEVPAADADGGPGVGVVVATTGGDGGDGGGVTSTPTPDTAEPGHVTPPTNQIAEDETTENLSVPSLLTQPEGTCVQPLP